MSKKNSFQIGFSAFSLLVLMLPLRGHTGFDPARYDEGETTVEGSAWDTGSNDEAQPLTPESLDEKPSIETVVASVVVGPHDLDCTQALTNIPQLHYQAIGEFNFNH